MSQHIYEAMKAIADSVTVINKDRRNEGQNYSFRGIEDFYERYNEVFRGNSIVMRPEILTVDRKDYPRYSRDGTIIGTITSVIITVGYHFTSLVDGSFMTTTVVGEGNDFGDKAVYKALSGAQKYALIQTFLLPTGEGVDAEEDNIEKGSKISEPPRSVSAQQPNTGDVRATLSNALPMRGGPYISEKQVKLAWVKTKNLSPDDKAAVLARYGATKLEEIPAKSFNQFLKEFE